MKNLILLSLTCFVLISSCKKEEVPEPDDFLIFGTQYGFCIGNCIEVYKLQDGKIFADTIDTSFANVDENSFDEIPLSDSDFLIGESVQELLPDDLWDDENSRFGCPDCYDQGSVVVIQKKDGEEKRWDIDPTINDIPAYLRDFTTKILEAVNQLE